MLRRMAAGLVSSLCLLTSALGAQTLESQVARLFTFGTCGQPLCLAGALPGHGQHFIPAANSAGAGLLNFIGNALSVSLSNSPISSTSSGVTFQFVGGQPVKTATSGGPIFGERAQTLGRGRFFVAGNVTAMHFQRLRGIRMDDLMFNFTHEDVAPVGVLGNPSFENDIVQVRVAMSIDLLVSTLVASYGLVDGVDLSVAVPVVHTAMQGTSVATIIPLGGFPTPHRFAGTDSNPVLTAVSGMNGSATGVGDAVGRLKVSLAQTARFGAALLVDARVKTGDAANFLGSGGFAGRGLGIVSATFGTMTSHLNFGYVFRDAALANNSVLATAGFDNGFAPWATMAFELISEWQVGPSKLVIPGPVQYQAPYPHSVLPTNIPDQRDDYLSSSIGFKFQTRTGMLVVTNAVFPLRNSGLQPAVIWTGGLEYSF